ncbi:MAG: hypothetical protein E7295_13385 [Lachnospiraceae bacterium]|jgi:RNA polymerase primary sigma factor|nr:hypothetical protein [Lachnospiraceae bacterium]
MNKELEFAKKLEEVKTLAKEQGNMVTQEQVLEAFEALELSGDQMQMVYDYLLQSKIGIGQHLDPEDFLTEKEQDYLEEYLAEIEGLADVSEGEKEAITLSAMAGDTDAQRRLTEIYLKEVPEIAKLYAGQGVFLEDLIGEGNVALTIGVSMLGSQETAEEALGMLGKMIMDAMEMHVQENADAKKIDARVAERVNLVADKAKELSEELRRNVTIQELMEESGLSEKAIRDAIRMSGYKIEGIDVAGE